MNNSPPLSSINPIVATSDSVGSPPRFDVPLDLAAKGDHTRSVRQQAALAAVTLALTATIWILLRQFSATGSWVNSFFFERSFVQWVSVAAFCFGLVQLSLRLVAFIAERSALQRLKSSGHPGVGSSRASRRFQRLSAEVSNRSADNVHQYARHLADADADELRGNYAPVNDVVQVLPLIGFFGTVMGLSFGLYKNFAVQSASTSNAFAVSIATAFDTTLLGLACTIVIFLFQSLLRKREEGLLTALDAIMGDAIARFRRDNGCRSSSQSSGLDSVAELLVRLNTSSDELTSQLRSEVSEAIKTITQNAIAEQERAQYALIQALCATLNNNVTSLFEGVRNQIGGLVRLGDPIMANFQALRESADALQRQNADATARIVAALDAVARPVTQFGERLSAREQQTTDAITATVRAESAELAQRVEELANRPRSYKIVEEPDLATGNGFARHTLNHATRSGE